MYDMTLSPREAIAKFQDLFNEHYYRCIFTALFACSPPSHVRFTPLPPQPKHEPAKPFARHHAPIFLHPRSIAGDCIRFSVFKYPLFMRCVLQAMDELDNSCAFSKRLYVPPTYAELRKIINIAQVKALVQPSIASIHAACRISLQF